MRVGIGIAKEYLPLCVLNIDEQLHLIFDMHGKLRMSEQNKINMTFCISFYFIIYRPILNLHKIGMLRCLKSFKIIFSFPSTHDI